MIEIGKVQVLEVTRKVERGLYLNTKEDKSRYDVLLPKNQISEDIGVGDSIEVFVYRDSEDRPIASLKKPKVLLGELGVLKVVSITHIGAFLDWGLERDLFLPFKQQVGKIKRGQSYLVHVYKDKSDRLCATMKVYDLLKCDAPYQINEVVTGTVYSIKEAFGAFVAVENKYHGLIPVKEMYGQIYEGQTVSVRIRKIRADGKLELSLREPTHFQIEKDAQKIMETLEERNGILLVNDKSAPEQIKAELDMSKAAFKRAVGRLLKEGAISLEEKGVSRNW